MINRSSKVLIFGGTGSLGKALCRRLGPHDVSICVFSRDEAKHHKHKIKYPKCSSFIGDVRDYKSVLACIQRFRPDYIINAAAMKQVPACEDFPIEAVETNVLGAKNVCRAAVEFARNENQVSVISVSTDKAVKPINAYGATKALQEKITLNHNDESEAVFNCVRYGNVLESTGSVIPLFKKRISENQVLQVTAKDMTRFLLSLDEAVDLILKTLESRNKGHIFVPTCDSAYIMDLAEVLLRNSNKDPGSIEITKVRPGEKIHEILMSEHECPRVALVPSWNGYHYEITKEEQENDFKNREDLFSSSSLYNLHKTQDSLERFLKNAQVI